MKRWTSALAVAVASYTMLFAATPAHATFPGRDGRIALYGELSDGSEIYSVSHTGTNLQRLTRIDGEAHSPDWSPDGTRIVFAFWHPDGTCSIELMNAHGSAMTDLTGTHRGCETDSNFTPDGRRIVFVVQRCRSCREGLWSMNLDGGNRRKIVAAPRDSGRLIAMADPSVSPNGRTIAFIGGRTETARGLYTVRMNGSDLQLIVPFSFDLGVVTDWAPDGDRIVATEYQTGPGNTVTVRPDGSDRVRVTHYTGDVGAGGASYSPDGRWIVYRRQNNNKEQYALWKMRPDGSDATRIRRLRFNFGSIHWGPRRP
jgi:TolB protein